MDYYKMFYGKGIQVNLKGKLLQGKADLCLEKSGLDGVCGFQQVWSASLLKDNMQKLSSTDMEP